MYDGLKMSVTLYNFCTRLQGEIKAKVRQNIPHIEPHMDSWDRNKLDLYSNNTTNKLDAYLINHNLQLK